MHSSRMRTGRSLTVCQGLASFPGGSPWQGVPPSRGVSLPGGASFWGSASFLGGCLLHGGWGVPPSRGPPSRGVSLQGDPPVDRITDTSKNITLATTSLRPVKMKIVRDFRSEVANNTPSPKGRTYVQGTGV